MIQMNFSGFQIGVVCTFTHHYVEIARFAKVVHVCENTIKWFDRNALHNVCENITVRYQLRGHTVVNV